MQEEAAAKEAQTRDEITLLRQQATEELLAAEQEEKARPSLIPSLCTRFTRAGIEWPRCHRAACMARPHKEPHHSGQAEP